MRQLAGRFLNDISSSPLQSAVAGGLATAGLSVGGNLASEEGREKGAARIALEALGAGVGRLLPTVSRIAAENAAGQRTRFAEGLQTEGSKVRGAAKQAYDRGISPEEVVSTVNATIGANQAATNTSAVLGGLGLATGLGGMVGGGVANIGNMAGLAIDPESPGSSNTQGSRMSMQTQQLPMY